MAMYNVNSAFRQLRDDTEFIDVTLAYEDGEEMEAHKVILTASNSSEKYTSSSIDLHERV